MGKREGESNDGADRERKERKEKKPKQGTLKHYFFLAIIVLPSLAWLISVGGDVFNNISGIFGNVAYGMVISLPVTLPILIAIYSKKLRGLMLKGVLPVGVAVLIFPTIQVYMCSPILLKNEELGTKFSLKTTAAQFLQQSCLEECLKKSKIPSAYGLSLSTPRVSIRLQFRQIINLNLTTSAMVNGEKIKVATLLILPSWRSVRGKYHALNIIARIPMKVKKLDQALEDKHDMIMTGRIADMPSDFKRLKAELEKQKRFVRPFVLEVQRVTPLETGEEQKDDKEGKK